MPKKTPTPDQQTATPSHPPVALWLMPLGGAALSLAFPNELLPGALGDRPSFLVAWVALAPLLWAIQALPRARYKAALLYGAGFALSTVSWVRLFGYIPWFLLALAYIAIFYPLALYLADRLVPSRLLPLGFALAFTGLEWARGQGMFGFPWAELGSSQVEGVTARIAAVGGIPLITFLLLWVVGAAVQVVRERDAAPRWQLPASAAALTVCLLAGYWQSSAAFVRWERQSAGVHAAVVQPDLPHNLKPSILKPPSSREEGLQREEEYQRRIQKLIELSERGMADPRPLPSGYRRLLIWPESALWDPPPPYLSRISEQIRGVCGTTGSYLLVGAPAFPRDYRVHGQFNTAYLLNPLGIPVERYEKIHLVPFGEFVPMRGLVTRYYTVRPDDILRGKARATLREVGVPLGVAICFETTFPAISRQYARLGAGMLVFITNDAWFKRTSAVRQHFNHARFRALETGLPVARTASTGISGFIAPDGRILGEIPTYREGVLTRDLRAGVPGTLDTAGGWLFGPACFLLALALTAAGIIRARRR